jgi:hypothetical protein
MSRRRAILIAVIMCATAVAVFYVLGNPFDPFSKNRFSAEVWRTADAESRARMARDAIRHHLVPSLTTTQVVSLLGNPDKVIRDADAGGHKLAGAKTYSYYLGCWSSYGFDDAFLYVHLDEAGSVISAEVNGY